MCAQKKNAQKKNGNNQENSGKIFKKSNIFCIVTACVLIAASLALSRKGSKQRNEYKKLLNALPELTTTEQILKAVNAAEERQYLISNYEFPAYIPVSDPAEYMGGKYICISVTCFEKGSDGKLKHVYQREGKACGRLFFDKETELLGIKEAMSGPFVTRRRHSNTLEYHYSCIDPDAKFTFVASLGDRKASVSGVGGFSSMVCGNKKTLIASFAGGKSLISFLLGLAAAFFILLVIIDLSDIFGKKKRALKKQQEEEEWKQTLAWQDQQLELARKQRESEEKGNVNQ